MHFVLYSTVYLLNVYFFISDYKNVFTDLSSAHANRYRFAHPVTLAGDFRSSLVGKTPPGPLHVPAINMLVNNC